MNKLKVKFDKSLNKYHIEYEKLKDHNAFRYDYYSRINMGSPLFILIETHLGSVHEPVPEIFARDHERMLQDFGIKYAVRPIEIRQQKNLFGLFSFGGKKKIQDFSIAYFIDKSTLTREMFEALLCEFDAQIGYHPKRSQEETLEDIFKGYFNTDSLSNYFGQSFFDSRLFSKMLATENLTEEKEA